MSQMGSTCSLAQLLGAHHRSEADTHQLQVLACDLAHCQVAVNQVDGEEQRLRHQLQSTTHRIRNEQLMHTDQLQQAT